MIGFPLASVAAVRTWGLATAGIGTALFAAPRPAGRLVRGRGRTLDPRIIRVLGARQLVQGGVLIARPNAALIPAAVAVDLVHALSMVAAAIARPSYRTSALASAMVATTSGAAGVLILLDRRRRGRRAAPRVQAAGPGPR